MKAFIFLTLISSMTFASDSMDSNAKECFNPIARMVKCNPGTKFTGWNVGDCPKGQVEGAICVPECIDPRVVFVSCGEGEEFTGWNIGSCENGLVEGPICVK